MKPPKGKPPSQRRSNKPSQQRQTIRNANVRYHEAGHAVACLVLNIGLEYVEIGEVPIPGGTSHGRAVPSLTALDAIGNRDLCIKLAIQALAGQEAEMVFDEKVDYTGKPTTDMVGAQEACAWCICELKDKEDGTKALSPEQWQAHKPEIRAMTGQALAAAKQLVRTYWSSIDRLAKALLDRPRMKGDEVRAIIPEASNIA